jgi:ABC-type Fe3+ transport system substrate-binding protein
VGRAGWGATVAGLIRHDLMTRYEHKITAPIAAMPNNQQDHIDDGISGWTRRGEKFRSAWWDVAIRQVVKEVAKGKELPEDKIMKNLLKTIRKEAQPSSK